MASQRLVFLGSFVLLAGVVYVAPMAYSASSSVDVVKSTERLKFHADIVSYSYSERGVVSIQEVADHAYDIGAVGPGMCLLRFRADGDEESLYFLVHVSEEHELTVKQTTLWRGGML